MAARKHITVLHVALAASLAASGAAADTQVEWRPRVSVMAGYDDNVQINGTGGDGFGQLVPGLKLDVFGEHNLRVDFDCQVGLARLQNPDAFGFSQGTVFANENCDLNTKVNLGERDKFQTRTDATYAQDPFALAGLGLLLRPGQTHIFVGKVSGEDTHALSGHTDFNYGVDGAILTFGLGDPGNGYVISPRARYEWKTSLRSKWDLGVREQLFFGIAAAPNPLAIDGTPGGLLDESHAALLGYTYEIAPWAELVIRGGPLLMTGRAGDTTMPTLRAEMDSYTPITDIRFTLAHDLVIGPSSAGPLVGDIAEVGFSHQWEKIGAHIRVGVYRNASATNQWEAGSSGYGGEAGVDWAFTRDLRLGISGERDARIYDPTVEAGQVNRDVVQVRLTYEKTRF